MSPFVIAAIVLAVVGGVLALFRGASAPIAAGMLGAAALLALRACL